MTIERIVITGIVRVNHGDGAGSRDIAIALDYEPGDNDGLARAVMARLREAQEAATLASTDERTALF